MQAMVPIISAVIGAVILLFGRKLFWLCVAAVGFAAGVELAQHFVHEPSIIMQLSIALVLGFIGALLALFLQKIAVGVVGFVAGGRLAIALATAFFVEFARYYWVILIAGGVIGALLLLTMFDWTLILMSSVVGAYMIQRVVTLPPTGATLLLVALVVVGVLVQSAAMRKPKVAAIE